MVKKKICLIGGYAVGKTSLVQRYVSGHFSDDYLTTVGVKIDQRMESVDGREALLMIWDLAGRDEFQGVEKSYFRGAAAFLYVADGTRRETLEVAREEMSSIRAQHPDALSILLLNKHDLKGEWELQEEDLAALRTAGTPFFFTSAKTGENVQNVFREIATRLLDSENSETG